MAKTIVVNPNDNTRVPFLRGILTHSLQTAGLPFEDAYKLASKVRRTLSNVSEISNADLRKIIIEHLQELTNQDLVKRYQKHFRGPAAIMVRDVHGESFPFSRSRKQRRIESCCLSSEDAVEITSLIYDRLLQRDETEISSNDLAAMTYDCIRQEVGADCAHRYLVWLEFSHSGRPLLVLIGGTAASDCARYDSCTSCTIYSYR